MCTYCCSSQMHKSNKGIFLHFARVRHFPRIQSYLATDREGIGRRAAAATNSKSHFANIGNACTCICLQIYGLVSHPLPNFVSYQIG